MPFGLPAIGETSWGQKILDSINAIKATADAALPTATAATTYAGLGSVKNVFTGKQEINAGYTNSLDTDLWIAGPVRGNPTNDSQGVYAQHRVQGDLGGQVHDGMAAEVRATSGTNASAVCGLETTAQVGGAGTLLADVRSLTSNFVIQGDATGSITNASVLRAQTIPALPAGFSIGTTYGVYVEGQSVGTTNWSLYAPAGSSHIGYLNIGDPSAPASGVHLHVKKTGAVTAIERIEGFRARLELDGAGGTDCGTVSFRLSGVEKFVIQHNNTTDELALYRTGASAAQIRIGNGYVGFRDGDRLSFGSTTGVRIGYSAAEKLSFYGAVPVVQPSGTPAAASDAATTQALVNDIRSKLITLGLIA